MEHRVRAAGIFVEGNRILLVCHRDPVKGDEWWIPPGGRVEAGDGSIIQTAQREIFEETGLQAKISRICYIREYRENSTSIYHLELFMPVEAYSGALTITNIPEGDLDYGIVKGVEWLDRAELEHLVVWPEWLKEDWFWEDAEAGFPETRYTGVQHDTIESGE